MDNIRVVMIDMPYTVKAYTIRIDDYYTIVLNSTLSHEQNQISYLHELKHIRNKDFESQFNAGLLEIQAHI